MVNQIEHWRKIENYSNYSVSTFGRIRNDNSERILKPCPNTCGYLKVSIKNDVTKKFQSKVVHRLVALAFIPNYKNRPEVDHVDRDRGNNHINNLRWRTGLENKRAQEEISKIHIERNKNRKRDEYIFIHESGQRVKATTNEFAKIISVKPKRVSDLIRNPSVTHDGWRFDYQDLVDLEGEIWRKIEGFDAFYVSNYGRVKREYKYKTKLMKVFARKKTGYVYACIGYNRKRKCFLLHRLVALYFLDNPENKPTVHHWNKDKEDNRLINLCWATHREQQIYDAQTRFEQCPL